MCPPTTPLTDCTLCLHPFLPLPANNSSLCATCQLTQDWKDFDPTPFDQDFDPEFEPYVRPMAPTWESALLRGRMTAAEWQRAFREQEKLVDQFRALSINDEMGLFGNETMEMEEMLRTTHSDQGGSTADAPCETLTLRDAFDVDALRETMNAQRARSRQEAVSFLQIKTAQRTGENSVPTPPSTASALEQESVAVVNKRLSFRDWAERDDICHPGVQKALELLQGENWRPPFQHTANASPNTNKSPPFTRLPNNSPSIFCVQEAQRRLYGNQRVLSPNLQHPIPQHAKALPTIYEEDEVSVPIIQINGKVQVDLDDEHQRWLKSQCETKEAESPLSPMGAFERALDEAVVLRVRSRVTSEGVDGRLRL